MRQMKCPDIHDVEITDLMYALSDPTRLDIVAMLYDATEPLTCNQLQLNRPKSTMSHHFKILRSSGLVMTNITGTEHLNSLRVKEIDQKFPGVLRTILAAKNTMTR